MKLSTPPYLTFIEEFKVKYKHIDFIILWPEVQPPQQDFKSDKQHVISLNGKRRYVEKALI